MSAYASPTRFGVMRSRVRVGTPVVAKPVGRALCPAVVARVRPDGSPAFRLLVGPGEEDVALEFWEPSPPFPAGDAEIERALSEMPEGCWTYPINLPVGG